MGVSFRFVFLFVVLDCSGRVIFFLECWSLVSLEQRRLVGAFRSQAGLRFGVFLEWYLGGVVLSAMVLVRDFYVCIYRRVFFWRYQVEFCCIFIFCDIFYFEIGIIRFQSFSQMFSVFIELVLLGLGQGLSVSGFLRVGETEILKRVFLIFRGGVSRGSVRGFKLLQDIYIYIVLWRV